MKKEKPSGAARAFVLCGPLLALIFTLHVLVTGSGASLLFATWFWAAIWSFLAALGGALLRAFHGDRTVFSGFELPERDGDRFDWATRTGRYAWRRDDEEGELHAHDDCPGHEPIA